MKTILATSIRTNSYTSLGLCFLIFFLVIQMGSSQNGLLAEYYDGKDFNRFVEAKFVGNIDDSWHHDPPVSDINPYKCSIRWTGKLKPGKTATYLFAARVDDGIRVWIDGLLIINQWNLNDVGLFNGKVDLEKGKEYDLKVEYFNALHEGEVRLQWAMEKSKADQSWYERIFGVEYQYQTIHSDFFRYPDIPPKNEVAYEEEYSPEPQSEIATPSKPKPKSKPVQKKPTTTTITPPPPVKEKTYAVKTVAAAKKYIPQNVQFERATANILEESFPGLNTFAKFMKDNPGVSVTIEGHTDVVGNAGANQFLSERRANRVARYLVLQGIIGKRIKTVGYGGSKPLQIPPDGEHHPPNRRVVFKLSGLE